MEAGQSVSEERKSPIMLARSCEYGARGFVGKWALFAHVEPLESQGTRWFSTQGVQAVTQL